MDAERVRVRHRGASAARSLALRLATLTPAERVEAGLAVAGQRLVDAGLPSGRLVERALALLVLADLLLEPRLLLRILRARERVAPERERVRLLDAGLARVADLASILDRRAFALARRGLLDHLLDGRVAVEVREVDDVLLPVALDGERDALAEPDQLLGRALHDRDERAFLRGHVDRRDEAEPERAEDARRLLALRDGLALRGVLGVERAERGALRALALPAVEVLGFIEEAADREACALAALRLPVDLVIVDLHADPEAGAARVQRVHDGPLRDRSAEDDLADLLLVVHVVRGARVLHEVDRRRDDRAHRNVIALEIEVRLPVLLGDDRPAVGDAMLVIELGERRVALREGGRHAGRLQPATVRAQDQGVRSATTVTRLEFAKPSSSPSKNARPSSG
jgi:hypothetical protein